MKGKEERLREEENMEIDQKRRKIREERLGDKQYKGRGQEGKNKGRKILEKKRK